MLRSRVNRGLTGLLVVGLGLRVLAAVAWWPVGLALNDSAPYTSAAATSTLSDVQDPAGYPAFLALVGHVSRQVAVVVTLQHLLGIAAAIIFSAAVRRVTGSSWWTLLPAAGILLSADQIYLEHNIMSEGPSVTLLAVTFYSAVRSVQNPARKRWALATGLLVGIDGVFRSAAIALVVIVPFAVALGAGSRRTRIKAAAIAGAAALLILGAYALANLDANHEFEVAPKPGWHLYGMVAHYAECSTFMPPSGTRGLCQTIAPRQRPGLNFYLYDAASPAQQIFGYFKDDTKVGAFAIQVVLHEPGQYLRNVALNLLAYFVPSLYPTDYGGCAGPGRGCGLNPELQWTRNDVDEGILAKSLESYYAPFHPVSRTWARNLLGDWQKVFRFGALLLTVTTLLTAAGFLLSGRRAFLVLFGGGGLSLLIAPSVIGFYVGRYSVPMAAPMLAAAAVAGQQRWTWIQERRHRSRHTTATADVAGAVLAPEEV